MSIKNSILVLGANGQLGKCLQKVAASFQAYSFTFLDSSECNISHAATLAQSIQMYKPTFLINAAAYTQVEKAEVEIEKAFSVNAVAVENLAKLCEKHQVTLIHISTDYVFDGQKRTPYLETDKTSPLNVYGASKLAGEEAIQAHLNAYYILRTSWLFSEFGNNFYTAMWKKINSDKPLRITTEQVGSPTNANDLALAILQLIASPKKAYGLYHFRNRGEATWYEFAYKIFEHAQALHKVQLFPIDTYATQAKRPAYSVLNIDKITHTFSLQVPNWETSLKTLAMAE